MQTMFYSSLRSCFLSLSVNDGFKSFVIDAPKGEIKNPKRGWERPIL